MSASLGASTTDRGSNSAYPIEYHSSGMTIREHLAGQAMQGLLANHYVTSTAAARGYDDSVEKLVAEDAVKSADALLKELEKGANDEKV